MLMSVFAKLSNDFRSQDNLAVLVVVLIATGLVKIAKTFMR